MLNVPEINQGLYDEPHEGHADAGEGELGRRIEGPRGEEQYDARICRFAAWSEQIL